MIKIRYVVEVVDHDCFGGTKDFSKSFDSEEEAWEYYREQQKYARNYTEPYFDQVYYANKPHMVEEEVEESQPDQADGSEGVMTKVELNSNLGETDDCVRHCPSSEEPDPEVHQLTDEEVAAYFPDYDDEIDLVELTNSL